MKLLRKKIKKLPKKSEINKLSTNYQGKKGKNLNRYKYQDSRPSQAQGIISAYCSSNNTHLSLTDFQGKTLINISAGQVPNLKKSSAFTGLRLAEIMGQKALEKGYKVLDLKIRGYGRSRSSTHRGLRNAGIKIIKISQEIGLPHNGCRPKKKRRL